MKENIQRFGRFLSGMVMPNIGAFIAWGFITAFFIPTGWVPNETFAQLVGPMITYLLPLLIGYTGGKTVYGTRGAVVGAIATMGILVGATVPMFLGAMFAGPFGGWVIKQVDKLFEGKVAAGFEMLVNNFSAGIVGAVLAVFALVGIGPVALAINDVMGAAVGFFVDNNMLPLTSIFVEPAKIMFLNNAINHGVFGPLGIAEVAEAGKSIFYLVEANPGPGLGLLLAYYFAGKGMAKDSAPGAIIIHFLGGIHEIYFPYVLMNPVLIIAMILGGASGVLTLSLLGGGLVAPASPGSIFAVLAMTERSSYLGVIAGVLVAAAVTFVAASAILKIMDKDTEEDALESAKAKVQSAKNESKGLVQAVKVNVTSIAFACDAGMGSSAMGATTLSKKLKQAGIDIKVGHFAIEDVPSETDIIITHNSLVDRVKSKHGKAVIYPVTNFMGGSEYDQIIENIKSL